MALVAAACGTGSSTPIVGTRVPDLTNVEPTAAVEECRTTADQPEYADVRPETWKGLTPETKKLYEMQAKYRSSLNDIPGVIGLGIGDGIIVYVLRGADVDRDRIPKSLEGCEVVITEGGIEQET